MPRKLLTLPESSRSDQHAEAVHRLAELEAELSSLQSELEHTQRLATLGILAAGVAHEINNILTPVLAYAQLASRDPGDAELQSKALEKVICGTQSATQIAQAILGFAGSTETQPLQWVSANILHVFQAALDCLGRDLAKDGVKLSIAVDPSLEVRMRPLSLQQVFINLVLNAREAMGNKGGQLSISASRRPDCSINIAVSDNGCGIPSDVVGRLFEPFATGKRAGQNPRRRNGYHASGTGLGLSICRRLVEEVGGTISATSKQGRGTTFTLTLPQAEPAERAKAG